MDLPFSVKPDKKLSVQDVMTLTRDKSYGTIFDPVQGIRGGPFQNPNYYGQRTRKISVANVEYTEPCRTQCRAGLPDPIGGIVWLAFGPQDTVLLHAALRRHDRRSPSRFTVGDHFDFNRASARWAFDYVDFHAQVVYSEAIKDVQAAQAKLGGERHRPDPEIDKQALALYKKNPAEAGQVPDRLLHRQRRRGHRRLVEAGRRPAGQVQPALDLRRQDPQAQPSDLPGLVPPDAGRDQRPQARGDQEITS